MRGRARILRFPLTLLLLCLIAASALVLKRALSSGGSGGRTQLEEKIDGGNMERYLDSADQKDVLLDWAEEGAPRERWEEVEPILTERCVSCHNRVAMPHVVPLDQYAPASRTAVLRPLLARKIEWGSMERYLNRPGEKEEILRWMEAGAPERGWEEVEGILSRHCVSCHNPETGVPGLVALDRYESVMRTATLPPAEPPTWTLAASMGILLAGAAGLFRLWRGERKVT